MFCSQCGRKIPEGLDNCPVCSGGEVAPVIRMGGRKVTAAPEERTPPARPMGSFSYAASLDGSEPPADEAPKKPEAPVFDMPQVTPGAFASSPSFDTEPEAPAAPSNVTPAKPAPNPGRKKNWLLIALAGGIVVLLVVLIIVLASNSDGGDSGSSKKDKDKKPNSSQNDFGSNFGDDNNDDDNDDYSDDDNNGFFGGGNNSGTGSNTVSYTGKVAPDLQAFSGNRLQSYGRSAATGGSKYDYYGDDTLDFVEEYIGLLQQNFTMVAYYEGSYNNERKCCFIYEGAGASSLSTLNAEKLTSKLNGNTAVHIVLWYFSGEWKLWYANGLDVADTGHRTRVNLSDRSGDSNNGGGGSDIPEANVPGSPYGCIVCDNTGEVRCKACSGAGGKYEYVSGGPNYSGSGSTSTNVWRVCSRCNGTGKQDCSSC